MYGIRLRSLNQAYVDVVVAAIQLHGLREAEPAAFMSGAWKLAYAIAPFGSEPLGFLLDPMNCEQYAYTLPCDHIKTAARSGSRSPVNWETHFGRDIEAMWAFLRRLLQRWAKQELPTDPWRRYLWRSLTLQHEGEHYGPPQEPWFGENSDDVPHLAAFCKFHLGGLGRFSMEMLKHKDFRRLSKFWQAYYRWHSRDRGTVTSRLLLEVVSDGKHCSDGRRKAALLLFLTDSTASPRMKVQTVEALPSHLLRSDTEYVGSPHLPVKVYPTLTLSKRERAVVLREIADKATPDARRVELVQELLGAVAENLSISTDLSQIHNARRMLVYGGGEAERRTVALSLAAIGGCAEEQCREWDVEWARDIPNVDDFRREVNAWAAEGKRLPYLQGLAEQAILATELQDWPREAASVVAKLLLCQGGNRFWNNKVVGCRDHFSVTTHCPATCQLSRGLVVEVPPLSQRIDDVPHYVDAICRDEVTASLEAVPAGQKPAPSVQWDAAAKKALAAAVAKWPSDEATLDRLTHIVGLINTKSGEGRMVTTETVAGVLDQFAEKPVVKEQAVSPVTSTNGRNVPQILKGWHPICQVVRQDKSKWRSLKRLNREKEGPIQIDSRGKPPWVDKAKLLDWWERMYSTHEELEGSRRRKEEDLDATRDAISSGERRGAGIEHLAAHDVGLSMNARTGKRRKPRGEAE